MSYALLDSRLRTARKPHTCIWCGQKILEGEKYFDERSMYEGHHQRHRWHPECQNASHEWCRKTGETEFTPWENPRPEKEAAP